MKKKLQLDIQRINELSDESVAFVYEYGSGTRRNVLSGLNDSNVREEKRTLINQ